MKKIFRLRWSSSDCLVLNDSWIVGTARQTHRIYSTKKITMLRLAITLDRYIRLFNFYFLSKRLVPLCTCTSSLIDRLQIFMRFDISMNVAKKVEFIYSFFLIFYFPFKYYHDRCFTLGILYILARYMHSVRFYGFIFSINEQTCGLYLSIYSAVDNSPFQYFCSFRSVTFYGEYNDVVPCCVATIET